MLVLEDIGRICTRCGVQYPPDLVAAAFRMHRAGLDISRPTRKWICRPCEQTQRDERKRQNRWPTKIRDVIRRHAQRLDVTRDYLVTVCGWAPDRLMHDGEFQYGNGCNYCGHPYREMGHGLKDITLDIVDRSKPPYYRTNTRWCCQTCNSKKGDRGPEFFEADRQVYERWQRQKKLPAQERGLLFDPD